MAISLTEERFQQLQKYCSVFIYYDIQNISSKRTQ